MHLQFSFIIQIQLLEGDELERNPWVSAWGAHFRARHKDHSQVRMVITTFFTIMMMLKTKMMIVTRFCNEMDHRIRNLEDIQTIPWFKVSLAHKYTFSLHIFIGYHSHVSYLHASLEIIGDWQKIQGVDWSHIRERPAAIPVEVRENKAIRNFFIQERIVYRKEKFFDSDNIEWLLNWRDVLLKRKNETENSNKI